jgi:Mlc titration factor MtfA (ptsG expression regulator)
MGAIVVVVLILGGWLLYSYTKKNKDNYVIPVDTRDLLLANVWFYRELDVAKKSLFESRVKDFLASVAVRGIGVAVEDIDRVLVAAGAIIPIFAFPDWRYTNISEVLLYPGNFDESFKTTGAGRNVLGMVGNGAMNRAMILSQPSLRSSFQTHTDGQNTAIHEFVHLLDKADGQVDGVPDYLLTKPAILPWISKMHETITEMKRSQAGDINIYGATNDGEFFAVVAEYFFERPEQLKERHPELFAVLEQMFGAKPQQG